MEEASFVSICTCIIMHAFILYWYEKHDLSSLKITHEHISLMLIVQLLHAKLCARKRSYNDDHNSRGL